VDLKGGGGPFAPGLVRLVDANTGQELRTLREHKSAVVGLAFAPDGKMLVSVGQAQAENSAERNSDRETWSLTTILMAAPGGMRAFVLA
jgi:hypothetical protein